MEFAIPADHWNKAKQIQVIDRKDDGDTNRNWHLRNTTQNVGKGAGRFRNLRTRISQCTKKSPGDMRTLQMLQSDND